VTRRLLKAKHVDKQEFDRPNEKAISKGGTFAAKASDPAGHTPKASAATPQLHLGGVFPGNHAGSPEAVGGKGKPGQAGWPQRERYRGRDPSRARGGAPSKMRRVAADAR